MYCAYEYAMQYERKLLGKNEKVQTSNQNITTIPEDHGKKRKKKKVKIKHSILGKMSTNSITRKTIQGCKQNLTEYTR